MVKYEHRFFCIRPCDNVPWHPKLHKPLRDPYVIDQKDKETYSKYKLLCNFLPIHFVHFSPNLGQAVSIDFLSHVNGHHSNTEEIFRFDWTESFCKYLKICLFPLSIDWLWIKFETYWKFCLEMSLKNSNFKNLKTFFVYTFVFFFIARILYWISQPLAIIFYRRRLYKLTEVNALRIASREIWCAYLHNYMALSDTFTFASPSQYIYSQLLSHWLSHSTNKILSKGFRLAQRPWGLRTEVLTWPWSWRLGLLSYLWFFMAFLRYLETSNLWGIHFCIEELFLQDLFETWMILETPDHYQYHSLLRIVLRLLVGKVRMKVCVNFTKIP